MQFTPVSEEDLDKMNPSFEYGNNDFQIKEAVNAVSKKGNDMIVLDLKLWDKNGSSRMAKCWLVFTDKMMWKIKNFCAAIEKPEWYEKGNIPEDELTDMSGSCFTSSEEYENKEGKKRLRANVEDFIPYSKDDKKENKKDEFFDDDIAFC